MRGFVAGVGWWWGGGGGVMLRQIRIIYIFYVVFREEGRAAKGTPHCSSTSPTSGGWWNSGQAVRRLHAHQNQRAIKQSNPRFDKIKRKTIENGNPPTETNQQIQKAKRNIMGLPKCIRKKNANMECLHSPPAATGPCHHTSTSQNFLGSACRWS